MSKKPFDTLTETMFYVLMSFQKKEMFGTEIANYVKTLTKGRVRIGPGTLYTLLSNFLSEGLIVKKESQGRKITYAITEKGTRVYHDEIKRLQQCLEDGEKEAQQW